MSKEQIVHNEILEKILKDLQLIKKKLEIEDKRFTVISNYDNTISQYEVFAKTELNLNTGTVKNHVSALRKFLEFTKGIINEESVNDYLESVSESTQSNALKSLRRFLRDFLKLGNWINDVSFKTQKIKMKTRSLPNNTELMTFINAISCQEYQVVFLMCLTSGLRINEVLQIKCDKIDFKLNCVDVSDIHQGDTKSSWFGFFTQQTSNILLQHLNENYLCGNAGVFSVTYDQIYAEFKNVSEITGIEIIPKDLRLIFVERCIDGKMDKNVIDIFEGRIPKGVQSKIYRNYSPQRLKEHYAKVENLLVLGSNTHE